MINQSQGNYSLSDALISGNISEKLKLPGNHSTASVCPTTDFREATTNLFWAEDEVTFQGSPLEIWVFSSLLATNDNLKRKIISRRKRICISNI